MWLRWGTYGPALLSHDLSSPVAPSLINIVSVAPTPVAGPIAPFAMPGAAFSSNPNGMLTPRTIVFSLFIFFSFSWHRCWSFVLVPFLNSLRSSSVQCVEFVQVGLHRTVSLGYMWSRSNVLAMNAVCAKFVIQNWTSGSTWSCYWWEIVCLFLSNSVSSHAISHLQVEWSVLIDRVLETVSSNSLFRDKLLISNVPFVYATLLLAVPMLLFVLCVCFCK